MGRMQKRYTKEEIAYVARFTITMAASFFDMSADALKKRELAHQFIDVNGINIEPVRLPSGARRYSLNDLRLIAHALRRGDHLTTPQFNVIINRIDAFSTPVKRVTGNKRRRSIYSDQN